MMIRQSLFCTVTDVWLKPFVGVVVAHGLKAGASEIGIQGYFFWSSIALHEGRERYFFVLRECPTPVTIVTPPLPHWAGQAAGDRSGFLFRNGHRYKLRVEVMIIYKTTN
jgi:hypothetical protein